MSSIHVYTNLPCSSFNVVMLSLLEVAFNVELLSKMLMSVLKQVFSELSDQSDHVVILFGLSVDIDSKIWLIGCQVHSFGILEVTFIFELSGFLYIKHGVFGFREVS